MESMFDVSENMAYVVMRLLRRDLNLFRRACVNLSHSKDSECVCRCYSSDATADEGGQSLTVENDEEMAARDVSRMPKMYRDRMKHVMNPPEQPDWYTDMFTPIDHKRRLYGKYGKKSGLDPGILWPSKEEVQEQVEFERDWEPSLEDMLKSLEEERKLEEQRREQKRKTVEKQMAKMPQFIKEYHAKKEKIAEQERKQEAKKRELLEEARDYFGYSIDPRDPRFQEMQERKEEEALKLKKQKKKDAKALRAAKGLT